MSKKTKTLSGVSARKYFSGLIAEGRQAGNADGHMLETLTREVAQLRVRLPLPDRGEVVAPKKMDRAKLKPVPAALEAEAPAFDPFAFSVVVALTKEGPEGLSRRLQKIDSAAHLLELARAQHIAVPIEAKTVDALRAALVEGTEKRIAGRRAAAS